MTQRLYYRDADLLEFDAQLIEHAGDERHVVLDRTAFYPASGGQPHDTGTLGGARVIDVIEDGDRIIHVTDRPVPVGPVHGTIDAARRRDHMQQHTAQHLLSALAADRHGWHTASVHFGAEQSTIEFAAAAIAPADLATLEAAANTVVAESRDVTVSFEDSIAASATLRKPSGRTGEIRIISIAGLDRSACGGTHVSRTSAIGAIALTGTERLRGHVRVAFVAGDRVLATLHRRGGVLASIAATADCAVDELVTLLPRRFDDAKRLAARVGALEGELAEARVVARIAAQEPGDDGMRRVSLRGTDDAPSMLRAMAQAAATHPRLIFVAAAVASSTVYFAASPDTGIDAGAMLKTILAASGGRGGGSARVAQGSVPAEIDLDAIVDRLSHVPVPASADRRDA